MHVLIGALVGAAFAVVLTVGMSLLAGKKPSWKHVALAALGGAVSGAIASATLGAGGLAAASLGRQAVGFGVGGAMGGASERVAENAFDGRPLHEGVGRATAVGGAAGLVSLGVTRAGRVVATRVLPPEPATASAALSTSRNLARTIMTAPTPGTGSGFLRGLDAREDALAPPEAPEEPELPAQELPVTPGLTGALGAF